MAQKPTCNAITRDGQRCKARAIDASGRCYNHSPVHQETRRRAAQRGGKTAGRGRPRPTDPVGELREIKQEIREVVGAVRTGRMDKAVGAVILQACNAMLRCLETERKVVEQDHILARLQALDEVVQKRGKEGRR